MTADASTLDMVRALTAARRVRESAERHYRQVVERINRRDDADEIWEMAGRPTRGRP